MFYGGDGCFQVDLENLAWSPNICLCLRFLHFVPDMLDGFVSFISRYELQRGLVTKQLSDLLAEIRLLVVLKG